MSELRCALCGIHPRRGKPISFEGTNLPGGWRCTDHTACRERVREIVAAHKDLAQVCEPQPLGDHPHNDPGDGRTECEVIAASVTGTPLHEWMHSNMRRLEARVAEARQ